MTDGVAQLGLVLDCADPERLAEFWAPAIGYVNLGTAGSYVALVPNGAPGPKLLLQRVGEPKTVKNRMHFRHRRRRHQRRSGPARRPRRHPSERRAVPRTRLDLAADERPRGQRVLRL